MVFANLQANEKDAFFSLLDESVPYVSRIHTYQLTLIIMIHFHHIDIFSRAQRSLLRQALTARMYRA
jgi:hypothetical protein